MNYHITDKNYYSIGIILYFLFSLSLLFGLFLNEDASGTGVSNDFKNTWDYIVLLKDNYLIDSSEWTRLLPLHYIFLSILYQIFENEFLVRLFFCFLSILIPFLFYKNLRIKFKEICKGKLLIISSILLILPYFRSSAIWPNPHITALIFLFLSIYYFQKWEIKISKKINLDLILHIFFLALTVYTRRYYVFFFLYFYFFYFKNLNIKELITISIFIFFLTIPGFLLIFYFPFYLESTGYNFKFYNTIIITSSIFLFYLIPFLSIENFKFKDNRSKLILFLSIIFLIILCLPFDYDPKLGGGYLMKLSNMLLGGNLFFFITALIGFYFLIKISLESSIKFFLIILIFLVFSNNYMFQKYVEPLWLIILFLVLDLKLIRKFLEHKIQIFYALFYFLIYSITSIINSIYLISINYFW